MAIALQAEKNNVCPDAALLGVTKFLDPVYKHLKYLDHWVIRVIKKIADAEVRAEGPPVCILGDGALV